MLGWSTRETSIRREANDRVGTGLHGDLNGGSCRRCIGPICLEAVHEERTVLAEAAHANDKRISGNCYDFKMAPAR